jgi:hypothetical protein
MALSSSCAVEEAVAKVAQRERTGRYAVVDEEASAREVLDRAKISALRLVLKQELLRYVSFGTGASPMDGRPYSAPSEPGLTRHVPSPPRCGPVPAGMPSRGTSLYVSDDACSSISSTVESDCNSSVEKERRFGHILQQDARDALVRKAIVAQEKAVSQGLVGRIRGLPRQTRSS